MSKEKETFSETVLNAMESVELKPTVFYILVYHRITDLNADLLTKAQNGFSRTVSLGVAVVIIVFRLMM